MKRLIVSNILLIIFLIRINAQEQLSTPFKEVTKQETGIQFNADILPSAVNLKWAVSPTDPAEYFELQRSADSLNFITLKTFYAFNGELTYKYFFTDEFPLRKSNFYRLLVIEKGGNDKRAIDLYVDFNSKPKTIKPTLLVQGSQLRIINSDGERYQLLIYNLNGTQILNEVVSSNYVNFPRSGSSRGVYLYRLYDMNRINIATGKLVMP
jgi:hypothetical protein